MRKLLYIIALFAGIGLSSCSDVEIGYLKAENANFSIDTLVITRFSNFEKELEELEIQLNSYPERVNELLEEIARVEEELVIHWDEYDRLEVLMGNAGLAWEDYIYDTYPDWNIDPNDEKEQRLMAIYEEAAANWDNYYYDNISPLRDEQDLYQDEIDEICLQEGLEDPTDLAAEKERMERQIAELVPWTTATIQQLLGTEPLTYSLVSVSSDNGQEAADDFASYLTVIGGGRMYVDPRVDSPAGKYHVTIQVSNEGHSAILENIFTFILK